MFEPPIIACETIFEEDESNARTGEVSHSVKLVLLMMVVMILLSVIFTATLSIHRFSGVFTEERFSARRTGASGGSNTR